MTEHTTPKRIQRKRTKGWRMPPNTEYVGRPSKWGNPCTVAEYGIQGAIVGFERHVLPHLPVQELRGRDLACWCSLNAPCHADVLIEAANRSGER